MPVWSNKEDTMRRMLIVTIVLLVAAGAAFAGGAAEGGDLVTTERIGNPDAPNVITFAARQTLSNQAADMGDVLTARYEDWAVRNPDYRIEITIMAGSGGEAMSRLLEQASAGRAPDIALIDSFFAARFYEYLQPLDDYIPASEVQDYVPFARDGMIGPDGRLKLLWFTTDAIALYYRTDLFDRPPRTWGEVIEFGQQAVDAGYTGFLFPAGRAEAAVMGPIWTSYWALGGDLVDDSGRPVFGEGQNRQRMIRVFEYLRRAVEEGITPGAVATMGRWSDMYPDISTGNIAMFLGGSWIYGRLPEFLGGEEAASVYSVAAVPTADESIEPMTANGGWTIGILNEAGDAKMEAMVDFIQTAYSGREGMALLVEAGTLLAPRTSVAEYGLPYFESETYRTFAALTENGRARPGAFIYPTISSELQVAISDVVAGRKSVEEAIDDAWNNVMTEYEAAQ